MQAQGQCTFHGVVVVSLKEDGLVKPVELHLEGRGRVGLILCTHTRTHARTHTRTHARTHTHTHTHTHLQ